MENQIENAIIRNFRLIDLLNILDARTQVSIFVGLADSVAESKAVYELLADKAFIETYGNAYIVTGLAHFLARTSIMIKKEAF